MNDKIIKDYLDQSQKKTRSCQDLVFSFIDEYFEKNNIEPNDSIVYKKADIDRRLFSKFRKTGYNLSKNNILKLCIALELSLDDTVEVLQSAGYYLSNNKRFDLILRYFISKGDYDIFKINNCLSANQEAVLC